MPRKRWLRARPDSQEDVRDLAVRRMLGLHALGPKGERASNGNE